MHGYLYVYFSLHQSNYCNFFWYYITIILKKRIIFLLHGWKYGSIPLYHTHKSGYITNSNILILISKYYY